MRLRRRGLRALAAATGLALAAALAPGAGAAPPPGRPVGPPVVVPPVQKPPVPAPPAKVPGPRAAFDVATYNIYLGADLNPLFGASSFADLVARAGQVYAAMEATNFPERAEAIADLLAEEAPDVVGLQEVALWATAPGNVQTPTAPFTVTYDFLDTLLDELAERGVPYEEVATNENFNGTLPISLGGAHPLFPSSTWASFTDRDVIVVRSGLPERRLSVDESSVREENFDATLVLPTGVPEAPFFPVPRGWSSVDVTVKGSTFTFFNTHLEAFNDPTQEFGFYRNLQAQELAVEVAASTHPPIVVGDINSRPPCDGFNTEAYEILIDVGLVEVWPEVYPDAPCDPASYTSGQAADLLNAESELTHRIDTIMFDPTAFTALQADVIGEEQQDRTTPTGLWPSDHAGSTAKLRSLGR
jgi:endonuclease/exonuclease/phosphatase family metal-dependent hydrolase